MPAIMFVYRFVNYDVFCNKDALQDFNENFTDSIKFFKDTDKSLLHTYFEHFIMDLEIQIGHTARGKLDIAKLKENLDKCINELKTASDYVAFD